MSTVPAEYPPEPVAGRPESSLTLQAAQSAVAYHAVMLEGLKNGTVYWSTWDARLGGTGRAGRAIKQCAAALAESREQLASLLQDLLPG
jgi:hypothetical protein